MKKNLLYLIIPMLFAAFSVNAQTTTTWDFGNNTTDWPLASTGYSTNVVKSKLGLNANIGTSTNYFGLTEASTTTTPPFSDSYSASQRLKNGGDGGANPLAASPTYLPTKRFFYIDVTGPCTVNIWFRAGGTGTRNVFVTDGTSSFSASAGTGVITSGGLNNTPYMLTANYTGGAGRLYIFGDSGNNFFKIQVIDSAAGVGLGDTALLPALATNSFSKQSDVTVYSKDKKIFFSNIKSSTQVDVYDLTGAVVKSTKTDNDSSLDLKPGVYIVKLKSTEGEKSVKVIVQ